MDRQEQNRQEDLESRRPKASNIFRRRMVNLYANTRQFLDTLLRNIEITETKVSESFDYPDGIIENRLYGEYGIFMNYFIRKHLSNQYQIPLEDIAVNVVLNKPDIYFNKENQHLTKSIISEHYMIFRNPQFRAMQILESIEIVSLAYTLTFDDKSLPTDEIVNEDGMLLEVIRYFEGLPYTNVELTPNVGCEYFRATPDFIFDEGEVLYEIKTSKYIKLQRDDDCFSPENFYKLIAYAYGYYKKNGKIIKTFKIYNPLLGYEHKLVIDNIDFKEFERCMELDGIRKFILSQGE